MDKLHHTINGYLNNPDSLFEEWYKKRLLKQVGLTEGEFTGILPSLEKIKEVFNNMLQTLKETICIKWGYSQKRIQFSDDIELIKDLANYLSTITDFPIEVATLVFITGLDKLCFQ